MMDIASGLHPVSTRKRGESDPYEGTPLLRKTKAKGKEDEANNPVSFLDNLGENQFIVLTCSDSKPKNNI